MEVNVLELVPIQSTHLSAIGYDSDSMTLQIQFHNGSLYSYQNVEPDVYTSMTSSGDPGRYFAEVIKPQRTRYVFTRVL